MESKVDPFGQNEAELHQDSINTVEVNDDDVTWNKDDIKGVLIDVNMPAKFLEGDEIYTQVMGPERHRPVRGYELDGGLEDKTFRGAPNAAGGDSKAAGRNAAGDAEDAGRDVEEAGRDDGDVLLYGGDGVKIAVLLMSSFQSLVLQVKTGLQVLRDKQEIAEAHLEFAKLLVSKGERQFNNQKQHCAHRFCAASNISSSVISPTDSTSCFSSTTISCSPSSNAPPPPP
ncbi:hypothetical protein HHK36_017682 [Tetracentron sinense]|uniref:Uncharacterized protein n=1 Tax=Tetracentron sinense TaxID=13715 RepID=A0A834YYC7_TETSI|nr:hypothetical protein HHK36_017682 [Tetracentron sinense]